MLICLSNAPDGAGYERSLQVLSEYMQTHGLDEEAAIRKIVREERRDISMQPAPQTSLLLAPAAEKVGMAINQPVAFYVPGFSEMSFMYCVMDFNHYWHK